MLLLGRVVLGLWIIRRRVRLPVSGSKEALLCSPKLKYSTSVGHGYIVQMLALNPKDNDVDTLTISAAWTRGLAAHPFGKCLHSWRAIHRGGLTDYDYLTATGSILIAFIASLSTRHTVNLFAPLLCAFSAVVILIAFAIQIALHLHVRVVIGRNVEGSVISAGPGAYRDSLTPQLKPR